MANPVILSAVTTATIPTVARPSHRSLLVSKKHGPRRLLIPGRQLVSSIRSEHNDGRNEPAGFQLARRGILAAFSAIGTLKLSDGIPPLGLAANNDQSSGMASAATLLGAPITDPRLILRSSLPKEAQLPALLEVDDNIRAIGGSKASQRSAAGSRSISQSSILEQEASSVDAQMLDAAIRRASVTINNQYDTIFAAMPTRNLSVAKELLGELRGRMSSGLPESRSKQGVTIAEITSFKNDMLNITGQLQSLLVDDVSVPAEYSSLPQLRGRAVAEVKLKSSKREEEDNILTVVLDGINAPITAGNFVDLSLRGFYNDMPIQRADGFVVQTGEKSGNSSARTIPMEVRYQGEEKPTYGATKEELGLMRKQVVLPFNAQGTMAMAHNDFDGNSADTQFFFLNKESEVTPSGANVLDGNYAVFGYVVENQGMLNRIKVDDVIESIRITYGRDRFVQGTLA